MSRPEPIQRIGSETVGEAAGTLLADVGDLMRSELQLAKVELSTAGRAVFRGAVWVVAGLALAYLALLFVLLAVTVALAAIMPLASAALLVGVVVLVNGLVAVWIGLQKVMSARKEMTLSTTRETLREDVEWLKNRGR